MEDVKQYLNDDADEPERAAAERIRQGLSGLRLEQKLAEVAAERRAGQRRRFGQRLIAGTVLLVLIGAAMLFFREKNTPASLPSPQPTEKQKVPDNQPTTAPEMPTETPAEQPENVPIAGNRPPREQPTSRYPAPDIRGENSGDSARQTLLNRIWYTDYPPQGLVLADTFQKADRLLRARDFTRAYVQLQALERKMPANDTLRFLKGYCLLEMGEGAEALRYFDQLDRRHPDWARRLEWYRGLGLLLAEEREKALAAFKKIVATPGHPYRQPAKKASQLLE